ncbi:HAMP domain-containing histidine kinase [Omnitrophica bacterium]|nr:HAMP domain-containing histidine kinase [Candidatus Omnitrophota bacterium]
MRITQQTPASEIREKAIQLYHIRLGVVSGLMIIFFLVAWIGGFKSYESIIPLFALALVEIIFNCPYRFYFTNSEKSFQFLAASVMTDFVIETLAIHLTGGIDAMFFSAIYLVSILYCALNLPTFFNFLMATLASLFYAGIIAAEYYQVIPHRPTFGLNLSGMQQLAVVVSHIAFFYLIAIFSGYLSGALIDREQRLSALFGQLREAHQKIRYAHRLKSEFIAHMTHELRNPLNTVIGFCDLLREPDIGPLNEKQAEYIGDIRRSGNHLLELINEVLDMSKLEARRMHMEWSDVDLGEMVRSSVDLFFEEAFRRQIQLTAEFDPAVRFTVRGDARKIRQIIYNLLSNALKFTPREGKVSVRLERLDSSVRITVRDSGCGISPEGLKIIFEPYEQAESGKSESQSGTGLGLAITKRFVDMHQGRIEVRSKECEGTQFKVTLPVNLAKAELEEKGEAA